MEARHDRDAAPPGVPHAVQAEQARRHDVHDVRGEAIEHRIERPCRREADAVVGIERQRDRGHHVDAVAPHQVRVGLHRREEQERVGGFPQRGGELGERPGDAVDQRGQRLAAVRDPHRISLQLHGLRLDARSRRGDRERPEDVRAMLASPGSER